MTFGQAFIRILPVIALAACATQPTPVAPTRDPNATSMYRLAGPDENKLIFNPNDTTQFLSADRLSGIYNGIDPAEVYSCGDTIGKVTTSNGFSVQYVDITHTLSDNQTITLRQYLTVSNSKAGYDADLTLLTYSNNTANFNFFVRQTNLSLMISYILQECAHSIQKADLIAYLKNWGVSDQEIVGMISQAEVKASSFPEHKYDAEGVPNRFTYEALFQKFGADMVNIYPNGTVGRYLTQKYYELYVTQKDSLDDKAKFDAWSNAVEGSYAGDFSN